MNLNPNETVRVKPTELGWKQIMNHVDKCNDHLRASHPHARFRVSVPESKNGFIEGQFWSLMQYFDWNTSDGLPFTDMVIPEEQE